MPSMALPRLAFVTADLPGIGGRLKCHPEDFQVEEIPAYPSSGRGTHTYALIQKTNLHCSIPPWKQPTARRLQERPSLTLRSITVIPRTSRSCLAASAWPKQARLLACLHQP